MLQLRCASGPCLLETREPKQKPMA